MAQKKTPGVYVEEKSLLPPSVAEVATAIPAFIGYTELRTLDKDDQPEVRPTRITSMVEYEAVFGGPYHETFNILENGETKELYIENAQSTMPKIFLYQSIQHFFANGGGACYVLSIGAYPSAGSAADLVKKDYEAAIDILEEVDEVTLISTPETIGMTDVDHYSIHDKSLAHSEKMMDRFSLVDTMHISEDATKDDITESAEVMREKVTQGLKYGAAYYPYMRTTMARSYVDSGVSLGFAVLGQKLLSDYADKLQSIFGGELNQGGFLVTDGIPNYGRSFPIYIQLSETLLVDTQGFKVDEYGNRVAGEDPYGIFDDGAGNPLDYQGYLMNAVGSNVKVDPNETKTIAMEEHSDLKLSDIGSPHSRLNGAEQYTMIVALLNQNYLILPPSPAIAGVMAKVDADRGVWKAPANIALASVLEPTVKIDHGEQEALNVHESGKSINAIRSFTGKGTLVWGARTLDGNSNEWRYVPVRRLFNMVEESVQKSTHFAVFEPNTPFTWLKIKTMIESYLENLWRQGALFGESAAQAFFVNVGLGQTMTEDDINNGYLKIEIGLAAVRPAEFIILTFSHKSLEG